MAKISLILLFGLLLMPGTAWAEPTQVASTDLIEKAQALDGQTVTYQGEIIGDIMKRGYHAWINVSDGANAIGVFTSISQIKDVSIPGRYQMHGDDVSITGTFHRACAEHGGDMDIHADSVRLITPGYRIYYKAEPWRIIAAAALILANISLVLYAVRKRHRH